MEEAPDLTLSLRDDLVYLTQGDSVIALQTGDRNFGDEVARYKLAVDGAQATGKHPISCPWRPLSTSMKNVDSHLPR